MSLRLLSGSVERWKRDFERENGKGGGASQHSVILDSCQLVYLPAIFNQVGRGKERLLLKTLLYTDI